MVDGDLAAVMPSVSAQRLAEVFVEVADTLVAEFDVIEFLGLVSVRTAELLDAAAVGVLLADPHGELQFMAASDEAAKLLELFEVQHREGPCLDAFRSGAAVFAPDIRSGSNSSLRATTSRATSPRLRSWA